MTRTAIITGASRGIGAEIAKRLAADDIAVIVNYAANASAAEAVVDAITQTGGKAAAVKADIGEETGMKTLFDAAEAEFGKADILVNNGGIMSLSPIAKVTDEEFERLTAINFGGTFRAIREAAHRLAEGGRIVNFSTSVIAAKFPTYGVYAATKAAVETLTHIAAKELAARAITVNAIAPGPVETALFLNGKSDELVAGITNTIPAGRLGQPADIAEAVAFFVSPQAAYISGQVLRVNGGMN